MMLLERRIDNRVPLEVFMNAYVGDKAYRGFSGNLSETGLYLNSLPLHEKGSDVTVPVGLEFDLPGYSETIWAAGAVCYQEGDDYFDGRGIHFTAMANKHNSMLRHFCVQERAQMMAPPSPMEAGNNLDLSIW